MLPSIHQVVVSNHQNYLHHVKVRSRLLEGLNVAVKQVQELQCSGSEEDEGFSEQLIQIQKLCLALDNILLHGLKTEKDGYWPFVKSFLHSETLQVVNDVKKVKSSIGKGRVWLYLTLNENSLESYINCFLSNRSIISKTYHEFAFFLDSQNLDLLQMLLSGLEFVHFKLNLNSKYLNSSCALMHISSPSSDIESTSVSMTWSTTSSRRSSQLDVDMKDSLCDINADSAMSIDDQSFSIEVVHQPAVIRRKKRHSKSVRSNSITPSEHDLNSSVIRDAYSTPHEESSKVVNQPVKNFKTDLRWEFNSGNIKTVDEIMNVSKRGVLEGPENTFEHEAENILPENNNNFFEDFCGVTENEDNCDSEEVVAKGSKEASVYDMYSSGSSDNFSNGSDGKNGGQGVVEVDAEDEIANGECPIEREILLGCENKRSSCCINLDNNALLYLSLEIFKHDNEEFVKLYETPSWKTEKLYVLITNVMFYVLYKGVNSRLFEMKYQVHFSQIDFITVLMRYQRFTIVCFDRKNKFTVDICDELVTRSILSNLEVSLRKGPRNKNLPSIYTDATVQTIYLKKCFDLHMDNEHIDIKYYAQVHWEDSLGNLGVKSFEKSGHFQVQRVSVSLFGSKTVWSPVYIVLQDNTLNAYKMEGSATCDWQLKLSDVLKVKINGNTLELMLDHKHKVRLICSAVEDCKLWYQTINLAKSSSLTLDDLKSVTVPSCFVIANETLFMCDEDANSNQYIARGQVKISDLCHIGYDKQCPYYCILVFEPNDSSSFSGDWILYFSSKEEKIKLVEAVQDAYEELFKVKLTENRITENHILQNCRDSHISLHF